MGRCCKKNAEVTRTRIYQTKGASTCRTLFFLQKTNKENTQTCTSTINLPFLHVSEESCWFRRGERQSRQLEFNVNSWPCSAKHVASRTQATAVKTANWKNIPVQFGPTKLLGPILFFSPFVFQLVCFPFDMWVCLCFPPLTIAITHLLVVMHSRHPHCCRAGSTSNSVIQSWPAWTCSFQPPALFSLYLLCLPRISESSFSSWTGKMFWFPAYSVYV